MKLGVFDSGIGGLLISKAIRSHMPEYDIVYTADTLHMPYGSRSRKAIYQYARKTMDFLFGTHDCKLVIIACNSATVAALRRLQREYLPQHFPDRYILGVVIPTVEEVYEHKYKRIGMLATQQTVYSGTYKEELEKLDPRVVLFQQAAPLLVPMIEHEGEKWIRPVLEEYLSPLMAENIEALILGCTHYTYLKEEIRSILGENIAILSQDEIIPRKLAHYFQRHPEREAVLSKNGDISLYFTDITQHYKRSAAHILEDDRIEIQAAWTYEEA